MAYKDPEEHRAYNAKYRAVHREEAKAYARTYRTVHRENLNGYRATHREEARAYNAIYRVTHRKEEKARKAAYRAAHREEVKARDAAYRAGHLEEAKARTAAYAASHPESLRTTRARRRARKKALPATLTTEQWEAIKRAYRNRCAYCSKRPRRLTQDHVVPVSKGGGTTPDNIVPACGPCNGRKHAGPPLLVPAIRLLI